MAAVAGPWPWPVAAIRLNRFTLVPHGCSVNACSCG
jgi:hypothetical protein